jgi:hypothetical protein
MRCSDEPSSLSSIYLSIYTHIYIYIYIYIYISINRSIDRSIYRSIDLYIYPSIYIYLSARGTCVTFSSRWMICKSHQWCSGKVSSFLSSSICAHCVVCVCVCVRAWVVSMLTPVVLPRSYRQTHTHARTSLCRQHIPGAVRDGQRAG